MSEYLVDCPVKDVRLALVNASHLKIASAKDFVPSSGKYTVAILRLLGLAAVITLIRIMLGLYFLTRKGRMPPNAAAD